MRALPFDESPQTLLSLIIKEFDVKEIWCILIMFYSTPHGEVFEGSKYIFLSCEFIKAFDILWFFLKFYCLCMCVLTPFFPLRCLAFKSLITSTSAPKY